MAMPSGLFDYPDAAGKSAADEFVFLPDWTEDEWAQLLRHTDTRAFSAGETVISMGEGERSMYVVAEGRLEIMRPRGRARRMTVVHVCGPGTVIGEQAFVDLRPRSATVIATHAGRLMRLTRDGFETFAGHYPALARRFIFDLARIISLRLREANLIIEREGR